jgi:hypothetical protein
MALLVAVLAVSMLRAQLVRKPIGARYIATGAYSKNFTDVFSFTANQAALAQLKTSAFGVYSERRYALQELSLYSAALGVATKQGGFGFQADYFGFKEYNEYQLGLGYGRSLGSKLDIGVKINYHSLRIPVYGNAGTVNAEAGLLLHLTGKLHAGLHVYNPVGGKLGKSGTEKLASIYRAGLGYEASQNFFMSVEVVKEEDQPVNVNTNLHYQFHKNIFVRAGIATESTNSFVGVGLNWKHFRVDVAASYHPQLGFTPGLVLLYNVKQAGN